MNGRSPAQVYAFVIGGTLVIAGIIGFFYSAAFDSPSTFQFRIDSPSTRINRWPAGKRTRNPRNSP